MRSSDLLATSARWLSGGEADNLRARAWSRFESAIVTLRPEKTARCGILDRQRMTQSTRADAAYREGEGATVFRNGAAPCASAY